MDGRVDLHFHVQSGTRRKTFGSRYRVEQHHTSKAAHLLCPEGSSRTFLTRVVRRALSKWTSPATPEPGSYWGAQGTQWQGRKQTNVRGTPPTAPAATSSHSPQQTFSRGSTTLLQEASGHSSCGSFCHRYKAMSHCNPCTESNCYQCATGQLQREVTETLQISPTIPV